jgi:Peptidase family M23
MPTRLLSFVLLALIVFANPFLPVMAQDGSSGPLPTPFAPATPTAIPRPPPANIITQDRATVELHFTGLAQGDTGVIHVSGAGLAGARIRFLNLLTDTFSAADDGFYGLVSVSMEQTARKYDLDVLVWYDDNSRQTINTQVEVSPGKFVKQEVTVPPDKAFLVDPEIERNELAKLDSVFSLVTLEKLWDAGGFQVPIPGAELTSAFGAFRTFNGSFQTRHTGWDFRATLGQPVLASAAGKVAYTGLMDIRGSIVVIDHGYGIFSTYNHFSQVHVTRGQSIAQGQVLGTVGSTGRTSGSHFHWEVAVNGEFVDALQFIQIWKP